MQELNEWGWGINRKDPITKPFVWSKSEKIQREETPIFYHFFASCLLFFRFLGIELEYFEGSFLLTPKAPPHHHHQ